MSEQLVSADPSWGVGAITPPPQPHPEARIGADPMGAHGGDQSETRPVTLNDLMENPSEAIGRIGTILKADLSDPKTWLQAGLMYFGPKVFSRAVPMLAKAQAQASMPRPAAPQPAGPAPPGVVSRMASAVQPKDVEMLPVVGRPLGQAVDFLGRMKTAVKGPVAAPVEAPAPVPTSPVESVSGGTPPPAGPPPEPVQGGRTASPQRTLNEEALARRRAEYQTRQAEAASAPTQAPTATTPKPTMSAPEVKEYIRLRVAGKTDQQAKEAILASRAMNEQFGLKVPTDKQTQFPKGNKGKSRTDQ